MDVVAQLHRHGWEVDMPFVAAKDDLDEGPDARPPDALQLPESVRPPPLLERLRRSHLASLIHLPRFLRGYFSLILDRSTLGEFNRNLCILEATLKKVSKPDAVLLFTTSATPGVCALVLTMYPDAVLVSLSELAFELKLARAWSLMRLVCGWWLRQPLHPFLYRAATPDKLRCVIFPSRGWLEDAVRYGLNRSNAHTIYFGVPMSAMTEHAISHGRLLWVGRMNPAKGLHHFVKAMPAIRSALPNAALTAIARQEDDAYEAAIVEDVARLQLGDALQIVSDVARADLQRAYAKHDMLLCISPFSEPVPLVMMEAFTAGLPVIISRPRAPSPLVLDGKTCVCFDPGDPRTLVEAIVRLHRDSELRGRITAGARRLVEDQFSLDRMGAKYDALLRRAANASP